MRKLSAQVCKWFRNMRPTPTRWTCIISGKECTFDDKDTITSGEAMALVMGDVLQGVSIHVTPMSGTMYIGQVPDPSNSIVVYGGTTEQVICRLGTIIAIKRLPAETHS